jgi:hypothetical protein
LFSDAFINDTLGVLVLGTCSRIATARSPISSTARHPPTSTLIPWVNISRTTLWGLNVKWDLSDNWRASFDAAPVSIAPEPPRRDEPVRVDIGYGPYLAGQTLPAALFAKSGGINTSNGNNSQLTPIFQYNPWTVYNYLVGWARGMSPSGR